MIKTLRIGNYDVVFSGRIGENVNTYDIVNFVRYDEKRKPIDKISRRMLVTLAMSQTAIVF